MINGVFDLFWQALHFDPLSSTMQKIGKYDNFALEFT